jgi:hypothetical protein
MSAFDTAIACARNMNECIIQNHFETPPYGPIPDAEGKLRLAVNGMIDALLIAMAAESQGVVMPPLTPQPPEGDELEALKSSVRQEHTLHREYAEALRNLPDPPPPTPEPEPEHEGRRGRGRQEAVASGPENRIIT